MPARISLRPECSPARSPNASSCSLPRTRPAHAADADASCQSSDRLAAGDRASLAALCGVGREGLDALVAEIRALDPKPGLAFAHEPVATLIPDVFVRAGAGRRLDRRAERRGAAAPPREPRLLRAGQRARLSSDADRRYFADCLQKASWLEKSLDQRARTVLKVATEIVRRQDGFLELTASPT